MEGLTIGSLLKQQKSALAKALYEDGAFLTRDSNHPLVTARGDEKGFKLALHEKEPDAPYSPYYLNIRVSTHPTKPGTIQEKTIKLVGECMHLQSLLRNCTYDHVVGIPNAGDPFAEAYSHEACIYMLHLIKGEEDGKRVITGLRGYPPPPGKRVLLVDDLVTSGLSLFLGIDVLVNTYKLAVQDVAVIVDREQGGSNKLRERGIRLHSIFTITELLKLYLELGLISKSLHRDIEQYMGR